MIEKIDLTLKKKIDELISLDNLRTFGISGIWKKYDITDRNLLLMHSPEWISYIENTNNHDVYIYYSIDSNGEYKINANIVNAIDMLENTILTMLFCFESDKNKIAKAETATPTMLIYGIVE